MDRASGLFPFLKPSRSGLPESWESRSLAREKDGEAEPEIGLERREDISVLFEIAVDFDLCSVVFVELALLPSS